MKNKDLYKDEIIEILVERNNAIALSRINKTLCSCSGISCTTCAFGAGLGCDKEFRKWAESETIEKYKLTEDEVTELRYFSSLGYVELLFETHSGVEGWFVSSKSHAYPQGLKWSYDHLVLSKDYLIEELLENHEVVE